MARLSGRICALYPGRDGAISALPDHDWIDEMLVEVIDSDTAFWLISPATFLIVLIFAWNEFLIALVLTGANAQTMPLQVAAQNATRGPQWWAMSVLILIMIAPVVAMAIALERYITRGLLVGALKG